MGKKSAPKAPDPRQTAAASTSTNIGTAIANAMLNNPDYVGPDGSTTTTQSGSYTWRDPYTSKTYSIPKSTVTTTLSGAQQAIKNETDATELNLGKLANQQSNFLLDYMGKPIDLTNDAVEGRIIDLASRRLNPELDRRRASMESELINRGIRPGSDAYAAAQRNQYEGENDAFNQLLLNGRQQAVAEALAARNQPLNEISALLSGSQVSNPMTPGFQASPIATTDVAGLINNQYQQDVANWQQKQAGIGGLFGLGAALLGNPSLKFSDRRLKTDIKEIGKTKDGQKIYSYRYKGSDRPHIGLMAQEVEKKHPEAVVKIDGIRAVDYGKALESV